MAKKAERKRTTAHRAPKTKRENYHCESSKSNEQNKKGTNEDDHRIISPQTGQRKEIQPDFTPHGTKNNFCGKSTMVKQSRESSKDGFTKQLEKQKRKTPSQSKITTHLQASKVTPPRKTPTGETNLKDTSSLKNPYKTRTTTDTDKPSINKAIAMETTPEVTDKEPSNDQLKKKDTKITDIFPSKQTASFVDAINGKTFKRVTKKYTRRFAVSFNVQIKIDGLNDGENQEKALRKVFE